MQYSTVQYSTVQLPVQRVVEEGEDLQQHLWVVGLVVVPHTLQDREYNVETENIIDRWTQSLPYIKILPHSPPFLVNNPVSLEVFWLIVYFLHQLAQYIFSVN